MSLPETARFMRLVRSVYCALFHFHLVRSAFLFVRRGTRFVLIPAAFAFDSTPAMYDSCCTLSSAAQSQAPRRGDQLPQNPDEEGVYGDAEKDQKYGQSGARKDRGVQVDVETLIVRSEQVVQIRGG